MGDASVDQFYFSANEATHNQVAHLTATVMSDKDIDLKIGTLFVNITDIEFVGLSFTPSAVRNNKSVRFSYHDRLLGRMNEETQVKTRKLFQHIIKIKNIAEKNGFDFADVQFLEQYNWAPLVRASGDQQNKRYIFSESLSLPLELRGPLLKLRD